ncbi:MAG: ABC transporter permease [Burkholderiales bacterium]|nr:MAG: ABC transporter permease [Burkholderiales bacterium]
MFSRILALVVKEFITLLKEKRSRAVLIVPPLIQLLVFGYAATYDLKHVPYAVYNEDAGSGGRRVVAMLRGSPVFTESATVASIDEVAPLVDARKVLLVVHIDARFTRNLLAGQPARLQLIVDGRNSNTALIAVGYVRNLVTRFNREWADERGLPAPPAVLETRAWFNPNLESRWFFLPGIIGILTLLITMVITAMSVAREREQGTFDQLLVTPMTPVEVLAGKALPGFIIGFLEATAITLIAVLWFDIPLRGSVATLYGGLALFLLSAVGVGLMISAIAVTQQQGLLGAFLFMVPAVILSGFATPIANMPTAIQLITYADPLRYFLIILRKLFLEGAPAVALLHQLWPMALIGVASMALAGWLFRHRMY